ncbi:hypothetical protein F3Y22_tig00113337pilonHSYRG00028 [Hibiscus syriacus]|uniref:ABC transporter domain-containing protein n=1 Tax=Hibiscus syriacus TaxID=106335 RepID=A0A6A2XK74_HIBSY|nr:hypothetical protein F3Y22_tig00113337pilonHSYRG00028 [Hibiscus syriacus]
MDRRNTVYQGPRNQVHNFFEYCGFKCPPMKGFAVFLQEVLSEKDQVQYWFCRDRPYSYVSVDKFKVACKEFHAGQGLNEELCKSFDEAENQKNGCRLIYIHWENGNHSKHAWLGNGLLPSVVHFCMCSDQHRVLTSGVPELALTSSRLGIFYKQRDLYFHPAWAYSISSTIVRIPFSFLDTLLWTSLIYFGVGYSPEPERFFYQLFIQFLFHQVAISIFRLITAVIRTLPIAAIFCQFTVMATLLFSGFMVSSLNVTLGHQALQRNGLNFDEYFYWISIAALIGIWILLCLPCSSRDREISSFISYIERKKDSSNSIQENQLSGARVKTQVTNMVLPFVPVTLSFENVHYFVDTPKKFRGKVPNKKLHLLQDISGSFRPGVLTALIGSSGAGKTTLMDVLSGRKTGGYIQGDIRVGGYPKVQKSYARVSGYCEQTDTHSSPYNSKGSCDLLSLKFVKEFLQMIELDEIKDSLVGIRGVNGISAEQHKQLTIAIELVANPSIIFMDEPTSGLDARAAANVMRVVKNIVSTKRTVVCTIHLPSIEIFETFDEIILMKGGQIVYSGELGHNSCKLIEYFEGIPGVPKIKENYNPATWMLEVTNSSIEAELGVDFSHLFKQSNLYQRNKELVQELRVPAHGSKEGLINIMGSVYVFMVSTGASNLLSILPIIISQRTIVFQEKFAGMYSSKAHSLAQVIVEIPCLP